MTTETPFDLPRNMTAIFCLALHYIYFSAIFMVLLPFIPDRMSMNFVTRIFDDNHISPTDDKSPDNVL